MYRILLFCLLLPALLRAQRDSTLLLEPERLTDKDILPRELVQRKTLAISATRSLEDVDNSPFTVIVFQAEDILRNGFVTLADVLKAAPGIRVSQPGSAVEGETWLSRGLSGNQYMKVLINDIPIKPTVALGMPIGAQLPIRQAERIEIMYGPAGAIYGDETCAGVVNIILKESERPVYTQADLAIGRLGYNNLDLMFGGKIGKDKSIFRFSIYGSSTLREKADVYYDDELYNTNRYLMNGMDSRTYLGLGNFRPNNPPIDSMPRTSNLAHESRMFGINLTWRGMHITYHRMLRTDAMALGTSPLAIGYDYPSNRLAERLETVSLGFQRTHKRRTSTTNFSFLKYTISNNSSSNIIFDQLETAVFIANGGQTLMEPNRQKLVSNIYNVYASNSRFSTAIGYDFRAESRTSVRTGKRRRLLFDAGAYLNVGLGAPMSRYFAVPVEMKITGKVTPNFGHPVRLTDFDYRGADLTGFSQLAWHGKRLHVVGGGSLSIRLGEDAAVGPRLGVLYHIDSSWTLRGNISTGLRHASLFARMNSYIIKPQEGLESSVKNTYYDTETNTGAELALRFTHPAYSLEGVFFWQQARELLRPGFLVEEGINANTWVYGYRNAPGLAMSMWGVQGIWRTSNVRLDLVFSPKKAAILSSHAEASIQYIRGREWFGYGISAVDYLRNQPNWIIQYGLNTKVGKKLELVFMGTQQSAFHSKSSIFSAYYNQPGRPEMKAFHTLDATARVFLSNHFLLYFKLINAFDRHHAGIDANGTHDDLLYNPQQGRQWRVGVNYNMN